MEERRFSEAEVVAKQAREIAPDEPVVRTLVETSRIARSIAADMRIKESAENGFVLALESVSQSKIPFDDREPIVFGDVRKWQDLSRIRQRGLQRDSRHMSPEEMEIHRSLGTKVSVSLNRVPLEEALRTLCDYAGVPLFIDQQGLAVEAVTTDQAITIELSKEVSLKSALNLILQPLRLGYVIENDVLKVTSEESAVATFTQLRTTSRTW